MKRWFEKYRYWINTPAMTLLGMFFFVAGLSKLLYKATSFNAAPFLETLPGFSAAYAILPYIEIIIGLLLINGVLVRLATNFAAVMVAIFAASSLYLISIGKGFDMCGCYGMAGRLTYFDALIVDAIMAVLIVIVHVCYQGKHINLKPWYLEDSKLVAGITYKV